ncbi:glycogen debranching enzyme, partial [Georgenia sp. 10Sc9-8]|nr:glycogen debranching enzyme [Georgenia halotolerans]
EKHNEANGEDNNDGESHNRSWNCGVEGPTDDPEVLQLRGRQHRNFLTTLFISQGVPMLAHGDELGRTQQGNNNVYCQDNELSWVDWELDKERTELLAFTQRLITLRNEHPVLRRRRFFAGAAQHGGESELEEIGWLTPDGARMRDEDWNATYARSIMVFLNGQAIPEPDERGERIVDDSFLVLLNADAASTDFTIPPPSYAKTWTAVIDTDGTIEVGASRAAGATLTVAGRSVIVLSTMAPEDV